MLKGVLVFEGEGVNELSAIYEDVNWVTLEQNPTPALSRRRIASQVESVRKVPFQLALAGLREDPKGTKEELRSWRQSSLQARR